MRSRPLELLMVGKLYHPARHSWPEGADYNFRLGSHELRMFVPRATPKEVAAVDSGPVEFGSMVEPAGLFLIVRFDDGLTFDCSYNWHMVNPADRTPAPPFEETSPALRALITLIFIEATTGVVLALRAVTWSPEFTRAIHKAIADQTTAPFDRAEHQRWADSMTAGFTTDQLWDRTTIRCHGGD
jgi:hypothetical protein